MDKIKNIIIIGAYPPNHSGGVATHVKGISEKLAKRNTINIITTGEEKKYWCDNLVNVYQEKLWYLHRYTTLQTLFQTTKRALLIRKKIDLYHVHGPQFSGIGFLKKKKPLVLTIHGYASLEAVASGRIKPDSVQFKILRWIEKKAAKRANAIISVDKRIYEWIIKDLNGDPSKTFQIPNGVDHEKFHPRTSGSNIRDKYNLGDRPVILFVKALSAKNGPDVAIKAMEKIVAIYPDCVLLIVGDGPLKNKLLDLAKKFKIENNIIFCGLISNNEVPFYYAASDIVVVPSVHIADVEEATSITMLEGMASGKPVVASNIGGLNEIIGATDNIGVLFAEGNYEDMAQKVVDMLSNESLRTEIGINSRRYIETKRNWRVVAKQVEAVYRYALKQES